MFQAYSYGDAFGLYFHPVGCKPAVYIPCRVSGGEYYRTEERLPGIGFDAFHFIVFNDKGVHACLKMHFTATIDDCIPHIFYDPRQFVGSDMGMGVYEYGRRSAMLAEYVQYFIYVSPLFTAGIELAVRIGSRAAFSETVIGFRVDGLLPSYQGKVFFAVAHILSAFHYDGAQTKLYQTQGGEQPAGAGSYNNDLRLVRHIMIDGFLILLLFRHLIEIGAHGQVYEDGPLACIDAAFQNSYGRNVACVQPFLLYEVFFYALFVGCDFRQHA